MLFFFISIRSIFFTFHVFFYIIKRMARAIQKMSVNKTRDFIFENYSERIGFPKENSCYSMKCLKKRFFVASEQINRKNT